MGDETKASTDVRATHSNVAPADEQYAVVTNARGERKEHEDGGPRQPSGSSGPTFPPPVGVDHQVLRDAGVANAYYGVEPSSASEGDADAEERPARKARGAHSQS